MATHARLDRANWAVLAAGLSLLGAACGGTDDSDPTGEELPTGGDSGFATGGGAAAGGLGASTGGTAGWVSGAASSTGGAPATGGGTSTGGAVGPTGGTLATGGSAGVGGTGGPTGGTGGATGSTGAASGTGGTGGSPGGTSSSTTGGLGGTTGDSGGGTTPSGTGGEASDSGGTTSDLGGAAGDSGTGGSGGTTGNPGGTTGDLGGTTGDPGGTTGDLGGTTGDAGGTTGDSGGTAGETGDSGGSGGSSGGTSFDSYNPEFVEFVGEDCDLPEPALLSPASPSLPDPFLMPDDSRMSSVSQWACQRAWLKRNIEAFVHGAKPGKPEVVTGSVSQAGVQVHVENGGSSADFSIPINLPPGADGPVPAMFQAEGSGVPTNFLHSEGVAAMNYSHSDAEGAFDKLYGGSGVSIQIKWAWAISRAIDVMVDERDAGSNDVIDPTALGTTGCSYAGKSAFTVGAFDERIALGIPMESGTGGLGSYRVVGDRDLGPNQGEDPEQVNEACSQNWLTGQVCSGNVDAVPADAHFMVAMYAPRGFTTLDNNRIGHLGPVAQYTAAAAGAEVFKALGVESHVGYHGGNDTDPHNHCTFYASQEETARKAIRGFLTRTEEPANFMEPKLKNQSDQPVNFDLGNYIDWDTPTLE